ncbi:MAG: AAA family ATPase [Myxococcales bacterium]|nr:AAA family ATPase [Myxococcales bacterium]
MAIAFQSLTIRNFRAIEHLELTFPPGEDGHLVVIAGENGCGKTSVLEALLVALGRSDLLPPDRAPLEMQSRFGSGGFELTLELSVSGNTEVLVATPRTEALADVMRRQTPIELAVAAASNEAGRDELAYWARVRALNPQAEYFSSRREPERLGETPDPRGVTSLRESNRITELKRRLVSAYYRQLRTRGTYDSSRDAFRRISTFLNEFSERDRSLDVLPVSSDPGSGDDVIVREGPGREVLDYPSIAAAREAAARGEGVPTLIPLDRLSSGELSILAFAGALEFRDRPPDLVVIDEPELHLHAQWQRWIIPKLMALRPTATFAVATHSRDVVGSVMSSQRFLLRSDSGQADGRSGVDDVESQLQ